MKKPFAKKPQKDTAPRETSLTNVDYNKNKLFKKGVNLMADEKLEDAARVFEQVLRIDPSHVDSLLKLGYAKFHLDDYEGAMKNYEKKNYSKALNCVEKAIESDPTYGMAWYNKGCFLSLLNQVPESLEALKRAIEIDVKNARKAVKDKDFTNVRLEEGFKRIVEVVVLESIRQNYHTIGAIVWTTFIDKKEVEISLQKLIEKGLIVKNEKKQAFHKIAVYYLVPEIAEKAGVEKKSILGVRKRLSSPIKNLK